MLLTDQSQERSRRDVVRLRCDVDGGSLGVSEAELAQYRLSLERFPRPGCHAGCYRIACSVTSPAQAPLRKAPSGDGMDCLYVFISSLVHVRSDPAPVLQRGAGERRVTGKPSALGRHKERRQIGTSTEATGLVKKHTQDSQPQRFVETSMIAAWEGACLTFQRMPLDKHIHRDIGTMTGWEG